MAQRLAALDALRGLTAAAVVIGHVLCAAGIPAPSVHWTVMIFFVLSGFVLALPWVNGRPPPWHSFLIRRLCRLWPPVAVSVVLSAALFTLIGTRPPDWLTGWQQPLSGDLFARCLLLTGQHGGCDALDLPLWSLVFETRISLAFPVLIAMTLHRRRLACGFAIVCGAAIEVIAWKQGLPAREPLAADGFAPAVTLTLHYAALFIFGILLAAQADRLAAIAARHAGLLIVAACAALCLPSDTANGAGAVLLIAAVTASGPWTKRLLWPPLQWLGRVSYSLYLIHWVIILALFHAFGGPLTLLGLASVLVLSAVAAEIMYRLVEAPSIRFGRWLTNGRPAMTSPMPRAQPLPSRLRSAPAPSAASVSRTR